METAEPELIDVEPGLWIWQVEYREWPRDQGWDGKVTSTCVESGGEIALLDPLAPANDASVLWERLAARTPKFIVILKPDHVRDVDFFARRYNIRAFGPKVFHRDDVPETELEYIYPGVTLPGGFVTLYDGRNNNETPLWLPEQRTIVFADALTAPHGELWCSRRHGTKSGCSLPCETYWNYHLRKSSSLTVIRSTLAAISSMRWSGPPGILGESLLPGSNPQLVALWSFVSCRLLVCL